MDKIDFSNYWVDRSLPTISISEVLDSMEKPFDKDGVAEFTYKNHFNNPKSQYYQKSKEEIIEMWEAKGADSRHYGSLLDSYIGKILVDTGKNKDLEMKLFKLDNNYDNDERLQGLCNSFDNFYSLLSKSGDTEFIDREKSLYIEVEVPNPLYVPGQGMDKTLVYYVKGRFDALFYNKRTHKWIVIDWKSSGSIDKVATKRTEKFLGPMCKYPALNYYRYTNQLHFYKYALLKSYLPKDTKPDDIVVMIVNLPGKMIEESGQNYMTHKEGMLYNENMLNDIFKFAIQKKILESPVQPEENEEQPVLETSDDMSNIF